MKKYGLSLAEIDIQNKRGFIKCFNSTFLRNEFGFGTIIDVTKGESFRKIIFSWKT